MHVEVDTYHLFLPSYVRMARLSPEFPQTCNVLSGLPWQLAMVAIYLQRQIARLSRDLEVADPPVTLSSFPKEVLRLKLCPSKLSAYWS